jgi:hypothetical protein
MSNSSNIRVFSLKLKTIPIVIDDAPYTLSEMTGAERASYMDTVQTHVKGDAVQKFAGLETTLLSLMLKDASGKAVSAETLNNWPAGVVTELVKLGQPLSGLNAESSKGAKTDTEVKNA